MTRVVILYVIGIVLVILGAVYAANQLPSWLIAVIIPAAVLLIFIVLPTLVGQILDPVNSSAIRAYMASIGAVDVVVRAFPNHYLVRFRARGQKHVARCLVVKRGTLQWKGETPEEMMRTGSGKS